jgi:hypothetical protein
MGSSRGIAKDALTPPKVINLYKSTSGVAEKRTMGRLSRTVNTGSIEPWLAEEKSDFAETSNGGN